MRKLLVLLMVILLASPAARAQTTDAERLGIAIDYFQSAKYHEALLILQQLDRHYKLNPRFRAYLGVCHYYEWQYEQACKYLDALLPALSGFAPQERAVYYHCAAESHFNLKQYAKALPLYKTQLSLCHENEKGNVYYKVGFCYMFAQQWQEAFKNFTYALIYYRRNNPAEAARISQTETMLAGIRKKLPADAPALFLITHRKTEPLSCGIDTAKIRLPLTNPPAVHAAYADKRQQTPRQGSTKGSKRHQQ